ncbi:hypothetical protein [Roseovarius sp. MMSF_3281]|uniref:hypothetical protein n=1 Tax=Roseovarius sp. MMSF_3281 TaxID=3046694 RepID=UPI00273DBE76|nr:hypothetical protein [Roseovarius sp. MMSF_3281]
MAQIIPYLLFDTLRDTPLESIWYDSAAFNVYRGSDWLPEPCQGCERRDVDFDGCRCQALALAGHVGATDPIGVKSPDPRRVVAMSGQADGEAEPADRVNA